MKVGRDISANNGITCITGLPRSGKSTLLKKTIIPKLIKQGKKIIVVDVNKEYTGNNSLAVFRIKDYNKAAEEVEVLIHSIINHPDVCDVLIVDESNVVFNKNVLLPNAKQFVNTLRHVKVDLYVVARRPVDINITISELAQNRYIFRVSGVNDIKRLNDIFIGLGDRAFNLGEHDYIYLKNEQEERLFRAD